MCVGVFLRRHVTSCVFRKKGWKGSRGGNDPLSSQPYSPFPQTDTSPPHPFSSIQVLWLGEQHTVTEVGAMNLLFFWRNEEGEEELVTPPLHKGDVLPGA